MNNFDGELDLQAPFVLGAALDHAGAREPPVAAPLPDGVFNGLGGADFAIPVIAALDHGNF